MRQTYRALHPELDRVERIWRVSEVVAQGTYGRR